MNKKPLIGFEPMTYALPWRYSTTELKGPLDWIDWISQCVTTMQIKSIYIDILYLYIYAVDSE